MARISRKKIARIQTGVRIEKGILQILKSLAAFHGISLSDLVEGIMLHSFDGKPPFGEESMALIRKLRSAYKFDLTAEDAHKLVEERRAKP